MRDTEAISTASATTAGSILLGALAAAGLATAANADARYSTWQAAHPYTQSAWMTHEASTLPNTYNVPLIMNGGLNTGWDGRNSGSSSTLHPNSLGFPTVMMSYQAEQPDLSGFIADFDVARANHTNLVGMVLGDEVEQVFGQGGLNHQRAIRDWIVSNSDPTISSLLTISSNAGGDSIADNLSVQNSWNNTYNTVLPDAWLAQVYPFTGSGLNSAYYRNMQWYFDWARSKDVAMWVYPQAWGSSAQAVPSESELRHQRFTSLGYGVKGFADFLYTSNPALTEPGSAYVELDNRTPTAMYSQLAPINAEVANIARSIVALTPTRAYHLDSEPGVHGFGGSDADLPANLQRSGLLSGVSSTNGNRAMVGFFKDPAGQEYFLVTNKDSAEGMTGAQLAADVTMTFNASVNKIRRLNRSTGQIETIKLSGGHQHTFTLPGGTGDLYKYAGTPFMIQPKRQAAPATLIYDDFEQYTTTTLPEVASVVDSRYTWSTTGLAATYGATAPAVIWEPTTSGAGDSGSSSGSNGLGAHPSGGLRGIDRPFPNGPISRGFLSLEADLSLALPLADQGSSNHANLILGSDPNGNLFPAINFEAGSNGMIHIEAASLGGGIPTAIVMATGSSGKNFHFKIDVDLENKTFIASVSGDANGNTGLRSFTNAFSPGLFALTAGRYWDWKTTWDNLRLSWTAPPPLLADIDNDGLLRVHDVDLLDEAIAAGSNFLYYDQNANNLVNAADLSAFLAKVPNWSADADGNWTTASTWQNGVPGGAGTIARFGSAINGPHTVTLDSAQTIGMVAFDNANSYTIGGSNALTFDGGVGFADARIEVFSGNHTISAPIFLASNLAVNVDSAGSTVTLSGDMASAAGVTLTKNGSGTLAARHIRAGALNVTGGTVRVLAKPTANDPTGTSVVGSLAISGTTLDLTNNAMVIDYTTAGTLVADIRQMLQSGKLSSSSADATRRLGYADNAALGLGGFAGQTVDSSSLLIKFTYAGDTNLDGQVDVIDLGNLATAWQTNANWIGGDSNYDGFVDVIDLGLLATNWQAGVGSPLGPGSLDQALAAYGLPSISVPEPGTLIPLLSGMLPLVRQRRKMRR